MPTPNNFMSLGELVKKHVHSNKKATNKYSREIKPGVFVDVYDVLGAFTGHYPERIKPIIDHATKKLLAGGERGHKSLREDMLDVITSAKRAIDIIDEGMIDE